MKFVIRERILYTPYHRIKLFIKGKTRCYTLWCLFMFIYVFFCCSIIDLLDESSADYYQWHLEDWMILNWIDLYDIHAILLCFDITLSLHLLQYSSPQLWLFTTFSHRNISYESMSNTMPLNETLPLPPIFWILSSLSSFSSYILPSYTA